MNKLFPLIAIISLGLVVLLGAVLFAPRCTATTASVRVGGMLLAGCER